MWRLSSGCDTIVISIVEGTKLKKTLKYVFAGVIIALLIASSIHIAVAYVSIANDPYTGAPAYVAFFLLVPYATAIAVCLAAWAIANKIVSNKIKRKENSADKCN